MIFNVLILGFLICLLLIQLFKQKSWVVWAAILMLFVAVIASTFTIWHEVDSQISMVVLLIAAVLLTTHNLSFRGLITLNYLLLIHLMAGFLSFEISIMLLALVPLAYLFLGLIKSKPWALWAFLLGLTLWLLLFQSSVVWMVLVLALAVTVCGLVVKSTGHYLSEHVLLETDDIRAAERSRIYQNIHDDVGAELLKLIYDLDDEGHRNSVKGIMNELRKAVAQTENIKVGVQQLLKEICHEARSRCLSAGISFDHQIEIDSPTQLKLTQPIILQRIIRELVSNCIKHAQANNIKINAKLDDQILSLSLIDDGIGIDASALSGQSKGMKSLKKRADQLGAEINWTSSTSDGTRVSLTMPIS